MGCATSKQKRVCRKCKAEYTPVRRSFSTRHRRRKSVDSGSHMVSLGSSTLGSLNLDRLFQSHDFDHKENHKNSTNDPQTNRNKEAVLDPKVKPSVRIVADPVGIQEEFAMSMIEAKSWSEMIDKKIPKIAPKTPIRTPPGEPEMINVRELMEGLDEDTISPVRNPQNHFRSFSFHVRNDNPQPPPTPRIKELTGGGHGSTASSSPPPKPQSSSPDLIDIDSNSNSNSNSNSIDTSIVSEFDPDVIALFQKALEDLPPPNSFQLNPIHDEKDPKAITNAPTAKIAPRGSEKLVIYFTSLRGVRKTYEDCCHVRVILKGLGVKIDERDVSMHSVYKDELKELLGEGFGPSGGLPKVFIGKRYIGGADEIRRFNEEGKLEKIFESCEPFEDGNGNRNMCEACGDIRFVPCGMCSGSCKIYNGEDESEDEDEDGIEHDFGFQRCPDCNENGLIRCPICCDE